VLAWHAVLIEAPFLHLFAQDEVDLVVLRQR
jgi:hypothetical protein